MLRYSDKAGGGGARGEEGTSDAGQTSFQLLTRTGSIKTMSPDATVARSPIGSPTDIPGGYFRRRSTFSSNEAKVGASADLAQLMCSLQMAKKKRVELTHEGLVHYNVAVLYAEGCLMEGGIVYGRDMADNEAGIYHLRLAAEEGVPAAALLLWRMHAGLEPTDALMASLAVAAKAILEPLRIDALADAYLLQAAKCGSAGAAAATAARLLKDQTRLDEAVYWYEEAVRNVEDGKGTGLKDIDAAVEREAPEVPPTYELIAKVGDVLGTGGDGIKRDPAAAAEAYNRAAEAAMEAMKGKLSNKYYEKAAIMEAEAEEEG
ncbi:hypothetical protein CYMTET_12877 [Cymbomonas tetramitiformis]|uniref:Uncharacterized protein n=1 Tax=Cymbomonas tetramitiformis TaxID=36881 RepID=A0AAE0GJK4_9CHLO|nr:hypothetical protein CYMTET_12877 [Cymbomonas tetramitiformis]